MVKIVVFDSGFGSLSVIKPIQRKMRADLIYFADQANFPYGKKTIPNLRKIIKNTISSIRQEFAPDLIVVGSNTPSILLGEFQSSKILGIYPPLKEASKKSRLKSIGILATENVVKSKAIDILIRKYVSQKVKVTKINCSSLVDLVESGSFINQKQFCKNKIKSFLTRKFDENPIDVVTLSSTHLPFLLPFLKELFPKIQFLDPGESIAIKISKFDYLPKSKKNSLAIYSSGNLRKFQNNLQKIGIRRKVKPLKFH